MIEPIELNSFAEAGHNVRNKWKSTVVNFKSHYEAIIGLPGALNTNTIEDIDSWIETGVEILMQATAFFDILVDYPSLAESKHLTTVIRYFLPIIREMQKFNGQMISNSNFFTCENTCMRLISFATKIEAH